MSSSEGFRALTEGEKFYYVLHPMPTVVIVTICASGKVNAMPASWVTPVAEEPPSIGVAVDKNSFTRECLDEAGEATVNVPSFEQAELVYSLGTVSGRDVDKPARFGLRLARGEAVRAPRWLDALASLECRVESKLDAGDTIFYLLRVERVWVRSDLFERYGWNMSKTSTLLHGSGRTFFSVGKMRRVQGLRA
ncbi:MAG: flavin reductase family protein [Fervidicoccaceae archaeon]